MEVFYQRKVLDFPLVEELNNLRILLDELDVFSTETVSAIVACRIAESQK